MAIETTPATRHSRFYDAAFFIALLSTALALGAALAHLLELPNKIGLSREQYFVVQGIYQGWNRLGLLLLIELASMLAVIVLARNDPPVWRVAIVALLCLVVAQALFWIFTYPANVSTANWTHIPDNWEALRSRWEYSHAAGAVLQGLAMSALIIAVLRRRHAVD
jgi:hypothetical protein